MHGSSPRPRTTRSGLALVASLATALVVGLAVLATNQSAAARLPSGRDTGRAAQAKVHKVTVNPRLFGVHDAYLHSLSRPGTGSIRLWDTGTAWPQMQPTSGSIDYSRLDEVVRAAHAHHTEVTLVVALTPAWAAASSAHTAPTDAPRLTAFKSYLSAVMKHYRNFFGPGKRGIANYQVWNEANIATFWTGSYAELGQLVKTVHDVRDQVDPGAKVVAPAMVTRLTYQQNGIKAFYKTQVDGRPVWRYVDALSFNLYPLDQYPNPDPTRMGTPEDSMALLSTVKGILAKDRVSKTLPIWNTEINYGLRFGANGGKPAAQIPVSRQVAYVIRTYLLNAARGVKRVDWYSYDMSTRGGLGAIGNTLLTDPVDPASGSLLAAGRAFTRVQSWMKGTLVGTTSKRPCIRDRHGTYTCTIRYAKGTGRVYWNPYHRAKVRLVKSATRKIDQYGDRSKAKGGSRLRVGYRPVLVRSTQ